MIVLDTNVVSELISLEPEENVIAWVDAQPASNLELTAVTTAELRAGVAILRAGKRRDALNNRVETTIADHFGGYALPFDIVASSKYGQVVASRRADGNPISTPDAQIAAICLAHDAKLATRNTADFTGIDRLELMNPWS